MSARKRKRIFILGGGASLGAHQVGAMKRLEEEGIVPDAIVGSSIGVINACLYASGGVANMEEAWMNFPSVRSVLRPSFRHNVLTGLSIMSVEPFAKRLEGYLDFEKIVESPLELSFILLNLSRGEGQFFSNRGVRSVREMRAISRAGYAIPVLFPPVRLRGEMFVDGGFAWNVPLLQAVEMGATEIYVLACISKTLPFKRSFRGLPDYLVRLADVMWRTLGNVGYVTTRIEPDGTYRGVPVTVVQPTEEHAGFNLRSLLSAHPGRSRRLLTAGYRDASRELARLRRARSRKSRSRTAAPEVEPAFRHEVA
jgi:predicted acylesterase/phospholipase RssA